MAKRLDAHDIEDIKSLYYIHRFIPAKIAQLYTVSHVTILNIVERNRDTTVLPDTECLLCGLPDFQTFHIDGNDRNKHPQNIISLCEAHYQKFRHLLMRKRRLISQF